METKIKSFYDFMKLPQARLRDLRITPTSSGKNKLKKCAIELTN